MAATIKGVALAPCVSKNGRWYTPELVRGAVERAQARIRSGPPMVMLSHHNAGDDSEKIVGRVRSMKVGPGGEAQFEAELADTPAGRTIATLVDGRKFLDGVSIRGQWLGPVRTVTGPSGQAVEQGAGLMIDGIDFTANPGVPAARLSESAPGGGRIILESVGETDEQIVERLVEGRLRVLREASRPGALAEVSPGELKQLTAMAFIGRQVAESDGADSDGPGWTELTESELRALDSETFRQYSSGLLAHRQQQLEASHEPSPFSAPGTLRSPFWRPLTG